jgi:sugar-specific transcriptional regulator TrmB
MVNKFRHLTMDTQYLQQLLEKIGFNHHESQVYIELLEHGEQPASKIAKTSRTPRSTIRSILDKLCRRGIVGKVYKGNTQYYFCLPTNALLHSIEQDKAEKQEHIDLIRKSLPLFCLARQEKTALPKVQYYEGEKGVIEAFNHSLYAEADEILFLTAYEFFSSDVVQKNDLEFYMPERVRKGIRQSVLSEENKNAHRFAREAKAHLRRHRFLRKGHTLPGNFMIYGNYVLYFSANDGELLATLTESALMAATMKTMFEVMWKASYIPL